MSSLHSKGVDIKERKESRLQQTKAVCSERKGESRQRDQYQRQKGRRQSDKEDILADSRYLAKPRCTARSDIE